MTEDEANDYFSQFTNQESNLILSAIEDGNTTFSELNEQLEELNTPANEIFSEMDDEDLTTFTDSLTEDEFNAVFSLLCEDENATYSDILDVLEYVNTFSDEDAATIVENTEELEKAAKAVTESGDEELAKKVKVLADKTADDAEIARKEGYEDLADEIQAKCKACSEVACETLDKKGVDPVSIDKDNIIKDIENSEPKTETKSDAGEGDAKSEFDSIDSNGDGFISKDEWKAAGKPAQDFDKLDANKDGKISKEEFEAKPAEQKTKPNDEPKTEITKTQSAVTGDNKIFSETTQAKPKYSTLKSVIN
jgi:hypothetical protein